MIVMEFNINNLQYKKSIKLLMKNKVKESFLIIDFIDFYKNKKLY